MNYESFLENMPSILQKIKYKIKSIVIPLIKLSLLINSPKLTAIILALFASTSNQKKGSADFTVLCLGRSIFLEDVRAMTKFSGRIQYKVIQLGCFGIICDRFIRETGGRVITENNYHDDNFYNEEKQKYYSYLKKMFPLLRKLIGFDAILTCNIGYVVQQEIARICEEKKIPFIVLHKEGFVLSSPKENPTPFYKNCRFYGAKILFYNDKIKEAVVSLNLPGLSRDKTAVVGIPRMDFYYDKINEIKNKKNRTDQITFFSFYPMDKLGRLINDKNKLKQAMERAEDFHKLIINFALKHKKIKLIIKTKVSSQYIDYVNNILKNNFPEKIDNLSITSSTNPAELIKNSTAIIGFNSATLVEGVVANKIVISPYFGDLSNDDAGDLFKNAPELINYVKTETDLEYAFDSNKNAVNNSKTKEKFLQELISTPDGKASIRAEEEIIKTIKKFNYDYCA